MTSDALRSVKQKIDAAGDLDEPLLTEATKALAGVFRTAPDHPEALGEPTVAVLHLIDHCLPGWSITLKGQAIEPDGHWDCSLRETTARDDDAYVGHAKGPTIALAALGALVTVALRKAGP